MEFFVEKSYLCLLIVTLCLSGIQSQNSTLCEDGELRLTGGSSQYEGRVELCYAEEWGTVCDNSWNDTDASVVCRQLGYSDTGAQGIPSAFYGEGNGTILLDDVQCTGTEAMLIDCPSQPIGSHNCSHAEDAGVICQRDINECLDNNGNCEDVCIDTEDSFICQCLNGRVLATDNRTCEDCQPGSIRLVNGSSELSGRIEVCIDGQPGFGTVCDDHWDILDAQVACRQLLGYSVDGNGYFTYTGSEMLSESLTCFTAAIPIHDSYYGQGENVSILMDDVTCYGNETLLESCRAITILTSDIECSHFEDAGVICNASCIEGSVRLLVGEGLAFYEGLSQYEDIAIYDKDGLRAGRLEVCLEGTFLEVCNAQWANRDASAVCSQLGYSPYGAIGMSGSYFGKLMLPSIGCITTEDGMLNCSHSLLSNCQDNDAAFVVCQMMGTSSSNCSDGDVRLQDGMSDLATGVMEGRLEICINEAWGSVCIDHFGSAEAAVVCSSFNLTGRGAEVLLAGDQGFPGSGPIFLTTLGCLGDEASLLECYSFFLTGIHSCDHSRDVWIKCIDVNECESEEMQACSGANSECINTLGSFQCQCLAGFAEIDGSCLDVDECEYSNNGCDGQCINTEGSYDCQCTSGRVWSPTNRTCEACSPGNVRLVNGTNISGRVEVCIGGIQGYGTICDDQWDKFDAQVVCRQLGFTKGAVPIRKAFFGMGRSDQAILMDDVSCSGEEATIQSCSHMQSSDCDHSEDAGVICSGTCIDGTVRLLVSEGYDYYEPGFSQYDGLNIYDKDGLRAGRVEICIGGEYGTICDDEWDNTDASVVCRQLGFSPYGAIAWSGDEIRFSEGVLPSVMGMVNCSGDELRIIDCHHAASPPCGRFSDAGVFCQDAGTEAGNCSEGSLRLTGGSGLAGQLEICINNAWGTICGTHFQSSELQVACSQVHGTAVRVFSGEPGIGPIYLSNLNCQGTEAGLLKCSSQPVGLHSCSHVQDVSIECEDIDECGMDNGGCQHICNNTMGSFECICLVGFLLDENGRNCSDIDECSDRQLNSCSEYASCMNSDGGYECSCMAGFTGDGTTCNDINECADASVSMCGSNAMCINTNGSFACECPPGFEGDTCSDIDECTRGSHECDINANCTNTDGSFICICNIGFTGDGLQCYYDIVLFGGTTDSEGQIGVCVNNTYATICDDFWDELDAQVVCRQIGLDNSGHTIATSGNRALTMLPALDRVRCLGNESSISACLIDYGSGCDNNEGAGVICQNSDECLEGMVRLDLNEDFFKENQAVLDLHGGEKYLGRVEVCIMTAYHTVCYNDREDSYAPTICNQLGFSPYGAIAVRSRFFFDLEPSERSPLSLECARYTADSVDQCEHLSRQQCALDEAGVVCQARDTPFGNCSNGDIRLAGGRNVLEGRVEICFNNAWGTVCGDTFSSYDAHVVCTSLGLPFNGTAVHLSSAFGEGTGPIFLSSLACVGTEASLFDCPAFAEIGIHNCLHYQDVGVTCVDNNECAINNGNCSQICINEIPGHQCSCRDGYTLLDDGHQCVDINECSYNRSESVLCHENAECVNTEGTFMCVCNLGFTGDGTNNCSETCITGSVQLVSNSHLYRGSDLSGRVEICIGGRYGTICDDSWSYKEAFVVCRQLGYSPNGAIPLRRGIFGDLNLETVISGVSCNGSESKLLECQSNKDPSSTCGVFNDAAVVCQNTSIADNCATGEARLLPTNYSCDDCGYIEGRVEVCVNNAWGTICGDSFFSTVDAGVVCSQLGGYFTNNSEIIDGEPGSGPIFLERVECSQEDANILDCPRFSPLGLVSCDHSLDVSIRCADIDECNSGEHECSQICNNTLGSHFCSCEGGYRLQNDAVTCEDIDECLESNETCPDNSICINTNGSFLCICGPGFQFQNGTCQDIDECLNSSCSHYASCNNTAGSFVCTCNDGFTGNGFECMDVNECSNATLNNCDINATCNNTIGNFSCECLTGFEGNGSYCQDIDECTEQPSIVLCDKNANCTNVIGSYDCECNPGYNGTGFTCTDIDECLTNTHSCDDPQRAICTNNNGSFSCQCKPGYTGSGFKNDCECNDGRIRLMNKSEFVPGQMQGRVEVCNGNTYFTVCNDFWDALEARVVCHYLGHNTSNNVPVRNAVMIYGPGDVMIQLDNLACQGNEPSLLSCSRRSINQHICDSSDVAGVKCGENCMEGSIRLVAGNSAYDFYQGAEMDNSDVNYIDDALSQGRVEICIEGSYGTICANDGQGWSNEDAAVVCSELGFTKYGATAVGGGFYTEFTLPALATSFNCSGEEARLYECQFEKMPETNCIHDAAVICQDPSIVNSLVSQCVDGAVRLVNNNSVNPIEGRVEVCINNIWGSVCNRGFNAREAEVICRQINNTFEGGIAIRNGTGIYGRGSGPVFVQFTGGECMGTEFRLLDCDTLPLGFPTELCSSHDTDAAVICGIDECTQGIHTCGDNTECIDRPRSFTCMCKTGYTGDPYEGCTDIDECADQTRCHECQNTIGSYICLCNEGYSNSTTDGTSFFCDDIDECADPQVSSNCSENSHCMNNLGSYSCVCNDGYESNGDDLCQDVDECDTDRHNCSLNADCINGLGNFSCECRVGYSGDGVNCTCPSMKVRLMNGTKVSTTVGRGRVEICYNNTFNTICDDLWDDLDARVVCNQLGFDGKDHVALRGNVQTFRDSFGKGNNSILLDDVMCSGNEPSVLNCTSNGFFQHDCNMNHTEDAAVLCHAQCVEGSIRLIPTTTSDIFYTSPMNNFPVQYFIKDELRVGRVEVCIGGAYGTVCDNEWDNKDASVVCHQLGFSRYGAISGSSDFSDDRRNTLLFGVRCSGREKFITECQRDAAITECGTHSDAQVICQAMQDTMDGNCTDGEIRLVRGGLVTEFEGRVEVCVNNAWGTISSRNFDALEVRVICSQKGFGDLADHRIETIFGEGSGPIFLSGLNCRGDENSLLDCPLFGNPVEFLSLSHSTDIGVHCEAQCSEFRESNEFYGSYLWPADTDAERVVIRPCTYQCGNITGVNASRTCLGSGSWSSTDFTDCPTQRTCQLINLITTENVSVGAIERIVNQSGIEDQNAVSFSIISQQFNRIAGQNMAIDDETITSIVQIVGSIQSWRLSATESRSPEFIQNFETIISNVVQQPDFTNVSISTPGLTFVGEKKRLSELSQTGRSFSLPSSGIGGTVGSASDTAATNRISLPSGIFSNIMESGQSTASLAFTAYPDSSLFPLPPSAARHPNFQIASPVIGASIIGQNISQNVSFFIEINQDYKFPVCVFWDSFEADWKSDGCSRVDSAGPVQCSCNHLTNFAILANINPVVCNNDTEVPNDDFTSCIDREPDVRINVALGQSNAYTMQGSTYQIGYGHEFGLECTTSSFFEVQWKLNNQPLPNIMLDDQDEPDYSVLTNHKPGQLYAIRKAMHITVLRTLSVSADMIEIGIQDLARGVYTCVAINGKETNSNEVTIQPTGWSYPTYLRFSNSSNQVLGSTDLLTAFFSTEILRNLVAQNSESLVAVNCYLVPRRPIDVVNGSYRYECNITSTNQLDLANSAVTSIGSYSDNGFCDYEMEINTPHGNYSWMETKAGDNVTLECFYEPTKEAGAEGRAMRKCNGPRMWLDYYGSECITVITFRFRQLANETITAETAGLIINELGSIVSAANDTVDQSTDNLEIISDILSSTSSLVNSGNLTVDDSLVNGSTIVTDGITVWPEDVLRNQSSGIVSSFETLAENLVEQNDNFTNITLQGTNLIFQGTRMETEELQMNGAMFDIISVINAVIVPSMIDRDGSIMIESGSGFNASSGSGFGSESGSGMGTGFSDSTNSIAPEYSNLSITLPPVVFDEIEDVNETGIVLSFYLIPSLFPVSDSNFAVGSPVIAASVAGHEVNNLSDPVTITLQTLIGKNDTIALTDIMCVSWNFSEGDWTTVGCQLASTDPQIVCECYHLTNFAILVDIQSRLDNNSSNEFGLELITYIGSILSIAGLLITIITLMGSKTMRVRDITKFHIQLCISLMAMLVVFLVGIDRTENEIACTFMSCMILYFALSSVFWMGAEAVIMFKKLIIVFGNISIRFIVTISILCWGVPLIFVIIALCTLATGHNTLVFMNQNALQSCFISDRGVFFGLFLAPVVLTIIFNIIMFILGVRVLIKSTRQKAIQGNNRKNVRNTIKLVAGICGLMTLFGLSWIFGVLTINTASKAFQYLFVIFNAFQGFYFFVFICLLGKDGRNFWIELFRLRSFKKSLLKSSFTDGPNSQIFKSAQSESSTVSSKIAYLSSSDSSAGLVFRSPHETALELVPGNLNVNDNLQANKTYPLGESKDETKLAMVIEESSLSDTKEDTVNKDDVIVNTNFTEAVPANEKTN